MNLFKHTIFCLIILSNACIGKEFSQLFEVFEPIESSSNIEKSINNSFNTMVHRLSGNSAPSNIWKIINAGNARKDFIKSYSIKNYEDESFIQVNFDKDLLIKKFKELNIPFVGSSRPVILIIMNIDSGIEEPYILNTNDSTKEMDVLIKNYLTKVSGSRAIFLEIPAIDLESSKQLLSYKKLIDSNKFISSQYAFDRVINIKLEKLSLDYWKVGGDMNLEYEGNEFNSFFLKSLNSFLEKSITDILETNLIDINIDSKVKLSVNNINDYGDYINTRNIFDRFIAINKIEIDAFSVDKITYDASIYGNIENLLSEITGSNLFKIKTIDTVNSSISMEFLK
ncbi:MAG: hypothetical protein CMD79_04615 [Gammaproteobacteria bacterium]|nr:hypothetical protein [Gammaproteobacteria bacterium]|tara:strand:- start:7615 stop:8634 length:1020 start_codon:yes stop_codon:yes gene_type:complete